MSKQRTAILIILAALGGFVLGRLSADLRWRLPAPPIRIDSLPFVLEHPGEPQEESELIPLGDAPFLGPASAKVTLVVFCDFECPFCRRAAPLSAELMGRYRDDLRLVFLNLPLDIHPNAALAAQSALAAHAQGHFWPFHDRLYLSGEPLTRETLDRIATQVGLDMEAFAQALEEDTYAPLLSSQQALAQQLGLNGTPSFLINGRLLLGAKPVEAFAPIIEEEIEAAEALLDQGIPLRSLYRLRVATNRQGQQPDALPPRAAVRPPSDLPTVQETEAAPSTAPQADTAFSPPRQGDDTLAASWTPVELRLYTDYASPRYRPLGRTIEDLLEEYPDRLVISFHSFLDPSDPDALMTSAALYRARMEDKLMEFHHALVTHEGPLTRGDLERFAAGLDFDLEAFDQALDDPENLQIAANLRQQAEQQGVVLSPTLFIGPHRFVGITPASDLRTAIRAALSE
ncbi:MAG: thioredoxin domain-containing protein [Bradymonadales bacterium]|nr:thioredoxin domain-containing protein [Bradymonadales bacterium]